MNKFKGFGDSETFTQLPGTFFHQLLRDIDDVAELKVTLYFLWRVEQMDGPFRALTKMEFGVKELGLSAEAIQHGLEKALERGSLLRVQKEAQVFFLLNSPGGRAGVKAIESGKWSPSSASALPLERPNVFRLYEENIGPLTPLIADALKDAEELYHPEWIAEAIEVAVKNNKRSWKYCEAILKRWKDEGRHGQTDQPDARQGSERYTKSEFAEYLD
jgi:DnaD/phage-associated family protein